MKAIKIFALGLVFALFAQAGYAQCDDHAKHSSEAKFSLTATTDDAVKEALKNVSGVDKIYLCDKNNTLTVNYDKKSTSEKDLKAALTSAGIKFAEGVDCDGKSEKKATKKAKSSSDCG